MKFRILKVTVYDNRGYKRVYLPRDWDRKYGDINSLLCIENDKYIIVIPLTTEKVRLIAQGIPVKEVIKEALGEYGYD